jgi:hypothetical protein
MTRRWTGARPQDPGEPAVRAKVERAQAAVHLGAGAAASRRFRCVLQTEVSALSPRVAFLDHQRSLLTLGNKPPQAVKQRERERRHECLDWLDKQPPSPVLHVPFGTRRRATRSRCASWQPRYGPAASGHLGAARCRPRRHARRGHGGERRAPVRCGVHEPPRVEFNGGDWRA